MLLSRRCPQNAVYILLDDASLAPKLAEVLCGTVWIGADRYDGMGKCRMSIEPCDAPAYRRYAL